MIQDVIVQGSPEWYAIRVGKVTASRVHDIVATTRSGGHIAGRKNYLSELVTERLTGLPYPTYQSAAMAYGSEVEPEARFAYACERLVLIEEVGFIQHPTIAQAGCSPDGLVMGAVGLVEIKCPNTAQMLDMLLGGKPDPAYVSQCMFQMACTESEWCDLVTFDKRLPKPMQLHVLRIDRDDAVIRKMELEVEQFLIDVDATVDLLRKRYLREAA